MKTTLVTWIHGIEPDRFDPADIEACIAAVQKLLPKDGFVHNLYNWSQIVDPREEETYNISSKRGNWLTRKVRKYICEFGLDMWLYLSTKKDSEPGDWYFDIQASLSDSLKKNADALQNLGYDVEFAFVSHSWGTKCAIDHVIAHPDVSVKLITLGSPLPIYGSSCFKNWGDPSLLTNLISWTNVSIQNDPVSNLMSDNPNPQWKGFVQDYNLSTWDLLPIKAHTAYWKNKKTQAIIAQALSSS